MAVSYTHLDVYKRQGLIGCVFTFIYFWLRGAIGFEKSMDSVPQGFIQMIAPIPVSYTHLDVYKRQEKASMKVMPPSK